MDDRMGTDEIDRKTVIVRLDMTFSLSMAVRTFFFADVEGFHTGIEERFC